MSGDAGHSYMAAVSGLDGLGRDLARVLKDVCARSDVAVHDVTWRVKTQAACDRKLLNGDGAEPKYTSLHDLLGLRVITLFESDLDTAAAAIRQVIDVDAGRSIDKSQLVAVTEFGYRSRHFIGPLVPSRASLPENVEWATRDIEIQLRTILQHAWAECEHDLGYKPERPISASLRRRFAQLAAVLEIADERFSDLRRDIEAAEALAAAGVRQVEAAAATEPLGLDVVSLAAFARTSRSVRLLSSRIAEARGLGPLPEGRGHREDAGAVLDLAPRLGWKSLEDVATSVDAHGDRVVNVAKAMPKDDWDRLFPAGRALRPAGALLLTAYTIFEELG